MDGITVLVPETNQDLTNCALHRTLTLNLNLTLTLTKMYESGLSPPSTTCRPRSHVRHRGPPRGQG